MRYMQTIQAQVSCEYGEPNVFVSTLDRDHNFYHHALKKTGNVSLALVQLLTAGEGSSKQCNRNPSESESTSQQCLRP